jgi:hypothetical protein
VGIVVGVIVDVLVADAVRDGDGDGVAVLLAVFVTVIVAVVVVVERGMDVLVESGELSRLSTPDWNTNPMTRITINAAASDLNGRKLNQPTGLRSSANHSLTRRLKRT